MLDVSKLKVVELQKHLQARGLPYNGVKSELIARLQAAIRQDESTDALDTDDIDSDGVLDDEDEKSQTELTLDESAVNELNEELALSEPPLLSETAIDKPQRTLKRKLSDQTKSSKKIAPSTDNGENKEPKKIVLNRTTSISVLSDSNGDKVSIAEPTDQTETSKTTSAEDTHSKLDMRAKRFGIPLKMSDEEKKEARKIRFGQNSVAVGNTPAALTDHLDKMKKRGERFGQNVSKVMIDMENKEKLLKRKEKFSEVK